MSDTAADNRTSPSADKPPQQSAVVSEHAIAEWIEMLDVGTKLLKAGLRREVGPDGDVDAAFRRWYASQMEEHDRKVRRILERVREAEDRHAG